MPGHSGTWLIGYPELGSAPGPYSIIHTFGVYDPALDPTKEIVYTFIDRLVGEMAGLFPDAYFHIGGDEVNGRQWKANAGIQAFIREKGLGNEAGLQTYFNQRVLQIVKKHGKRMMGWDEILHKDLPKDIVVESWQNHESLATAAARGYQGLLSFGYYLDHLKLAGEYYAVDPFGGPGAALTAEQRKNVLGGEACMWTEFISPETIDSRMWPKSAAVAERLWSALAQTPTHQLAAGRFVEHLCRLWMLGVRAGPIGPNFCPADAVMPAAAAASRARAVLRATAPAGDDGSVTLSRAQVEALREALREL